MITKVTAENYRAFTVSEKHVLILCDAEWNKNKELIEQFRELAADQEKNPGVGEFAFGEAVMEDQGLWEFFREWNVSNLPAVLYIWNDVAFPMKSTKIGNHDIKAHVRDVIMEKMMRKMGLDTETMN